MSINCGENAKRKVFFMMFKTEKRAISNKITTCPRSENPNLTRHFCNGVKSICFCGGKHAVLRSWVHMDLLCPTPEAGPVPGAPLTAPLTQPQKPPVPGFLQYSQVTSPSA